ncbi:MAG TPA: biotin--[acetyl-CoA-carboxylase] ligase [Chitinophagaceae bacterium]|nr:biotin--[acetyl-CoA-carboxylase] ligase [Chitinophagaceae bacterium]
MPQALQRSPNGPSTNIIGSPFIELQSVDSTNNYARQQIHAGLAQHGQAFFAHDQVAGKGQRGKVWLAEPGQNIILSIVVDPAALKVDQQFQLNACVALVLLDLFKKYGGDETRIKWPNDLYWQDRKAGGVLIESGVRSRSERTPLEESGASTWEWLIVGIGININQTSFPSSLPNPVSLKQITGKTFDPVELAIELCAILETRFSQLISIGFEKIYEDYLSGLYKKGELVKFKKDNRIFEAIVRTVTTSGKLVVQHTIEEEFDFGEVEWMASPTRY